MSPRPLQTSYLLRLWPVEINRQTVWHASLTPIPGGEIQGFATLEQLFFYLENQTTQSTCRSGEKQSPLSLPHERTSP